MHPVLKTVLGRLSLGLATLFIVSIIIFSAIEMLPGDFGQAILGQAATEETVAAFRRELGLDEPPYIRYMQWVGSAIQGDLGTSFSGRNASGTWSATNEALRFVPVVSGPTTISVVASGIMGEVRSQVSFFVQ